MPWLFAFSWVCRTSVPLASATLAVIPAKAGIQLLCLGSSHSLGCVEPRFRSPRQLSPSSRRRPGSSSYALALRILLGVSNLGSARLGGERVTSLLAKREVTKRNAFPASAPIGRCPIGSLRCSPPSGRRTTRPSQGACTAESVRAAKPATRSISPPLLGPWNHHGPAKRRRTVLAHQASRLERFCRAGSQPQTVRLSPLGGCAPRRCCRGEGQGRSQSQRHGQSRSRSRSQNNSQSGDVILFRSS